MSSGLLDEFEQTKALCAEPYVEYSDTGTVLGWLMIAGSGVDTRAKRMD